MASMTSQPTPAGSVSASTTDTASSPSHAIRRWWHDIGRFALSKARRMPITADGGGSNGSRRAAVETELQMLADELGIEITVCHVPPGTSSRVDDWRGGGRSRG